MTSNPELNVTNIPFIFDIFENSPLYQNCEHANYGIGGVFSLLLNRKIPIDLVIQESQVISCSTYRNG